MRIIAIPWLRSISKAEDFGWVTRKLMDLADRTAGGRIVSVLEGGYDLQGLKELVAAHVSALMGSASWRRIRSRNMIMVRNGLRKMRLGIERIRETDMAENAQADVKKLSFERAMEELESIVKRLEDGKVPLEELVAIYERGEALKRRCEELLRQAEARVDKITTDASGQPTGTEPLDVQ